jgi:hypothetical protein
MRISFLLIMLALVICSCEIPALEMRRSNNPHVNVELLFEHEGVKVYRFIDGGKPHYFTSNGSMTGQTE